VRRGGRHGWADPDDPIAFHGEAGYQAVLLMPGLRFKIWPMLGVNVVDPDPDPATRE
jgi:hypothetical protein